MTVTRVATDAQVLEAVLAEAARRAGFHFIQKHWPDAQADRPYRLLAPAEAVVLALIDADARHVELLGLMRRNMQAYEKAFTEFLTGARAIVDLAARTPEPSLFDQPPLDSTALVEALVRALTPRAATPGRPEDGPYPASTAEVLVEVGAELAELGLHITTLPT